MKPWLKHIALVMLSVSAFITFVVLAFTWLMTGNIIP